MRETSDPSSNTKRHSRPLLAASCAQKRGDWLSPTVWVSALVWTVVAFATEPQVKVRKARPVHKRNHASENMLDPMWDLVLEGGVANSRPCRDSMERPHDLMFCCASGSPLLQTAWHPWSSLRPIVSTYPAQTRHFKQTTKERTNRRCAPYEATHSSLALFPPHLSEIHAPNHCDLPNPSLLPFQLLIDIMGGCAGCAAVSLELSITLETVFSL